MHDYQCRVCGLVGEQLHKRPAPEVAACKDCGADADKVLSATYGYLPDLEFVTGKSDPVAVKMLERRMRQAEEHKSNRPI